MTKRSLTPSLPASLAFPPEKTQTADLLLSSERTLVPVLSSQDDDPEDQANLPQDDDPLALVEAAPLAILSLRQTLARLHGGQKLRTILDLPDPKALIQRLPPQELLWTFKDIGLADASELLQLASVEQIRFCLDLDLWRKDHLLPENLHDWFQPLLAREFEVTEHLLKAIDQDVLQLFLRSLIRVFQVTEDDEVPEEIEGEWVQTPDRVYLIEIIAPPGDPRNTLAHALLELFFAYGPAFCTPFFELMRHNLASSLEEAAYHFHKARMEDLGFLDYYEAIAIYQPLPLERLPSAPAEVLVSEVRLPILTIPPSSGLFSKASSRLTEPSIQRRLRTEIVLLTNKLLVADQADLSDPQIVASSMRSALQTIDLGLDLLAHSDLEDAIHQIRLHSLEGIFRIGFSSLVRLRHRAAAIFRRDDLRLTDDLPLSLFSQDERDFLDSLRLLKPRFHTALFGEGPSSRPFRSRHDLQNAEAVLSYLEWLPTLLFDLFGFSLPVLKLQIPDLLSPHDPASIRALHLFLTALANYTLRQRFSPDPIAPSELPLLLSSWFEPSAPPPRPFLPSFQRSVEDALLSLAPSDAHRPHLQRLLTHAWQILQDEIASLDPSAQADPRFLSVFLFRSPL